MLYLLHSKFVLLRQPTGNCAFSALLSPITFPWTLLSFMCGALKQGRLGSLLLVKFPVQVLLGLWKKASNGTSLQADDSHLFPISLPVLTFALFAWLCPSLISEWELKDKSGVQCSKRFNNSTRESLNLSASLPWC